MPDNSSLAFCSRLKHRILQSLLVAVFALLFLPSAADAAWFDNDWEFRKPFDVSNATSTLSNFQVNLKLDTESLISAGKMRSDCGDLRLTDTDGSTAISHWVESGCNASSTSIWTKVPTITGNATTTIYAYYGNSTATSTSSLASTSETVPSDVLVLHAGNCTSLTDELTSEGISFATSTPATVSASSVPTLLSDYYAIYACTNEGIKDGDTQAMMDGGSIETYVDHGGKFVANGAF